MTTAAIDAQGTLIKVGDGASPEVFTTIAEALELRWTGLSTSVQEVTNHDTTSGYRDWAPRNRDGGQFQFDIYYLPNNATHKAAARGLKQLWVDGTQVNWQVVYPSSPTVTDTFVGFVSDFEVTAPPVDGNLTASVTIKITGAPTLA